MKESDNIINFNARRDQKIESKRRNFERILFSDFLGSYGVIDHFEHLYKVKFIDISYSGCQFQIPMERDEKNLFPIGGELLMRLYFTPESYLPMVVNIRHGKEHFDAKGKRYMRFGCQFDQDISSYQALKGFVDFIGLFAQHSVVGQKKERLFFL